MVPPGATTLEGRENWRYAKESEGYFTRENGLRILDEKGVEVVVPVKAVVRGGGVDR